MKKHLVGSLATIIALAFVLGGCKSNKDQTANSSASSAPMDSRKPVISIAELMIDKISNSADSGKSMGSSILKLRKYDNLLYKTLHDSTRSLRQKYFYSRRGSCCPCSSGGSTCCPCSKGSALAVADGAIAAAERIDDKRSVFMFAKLTAANQTNIAPLTLDSQVIDGMRVFTVPEKTSAGTYTVKFKGVLIDLTLVIEIDQKENIEITKIE